MIMVYKKKVPVPGSPDVLHVDINQPVLDEHAALVVTQAPYSQHTVALYRTAIFNIAPAIPRWKHQFP